MAQPVGHTQAIRATGHPTPRLDKLQEVKKWDFFLPQHLDKAFSVCVQVHTAGKSKDRPQCGAGHMDRKILCNMALLGWGFGVAVEQLRPGICPTNLQQGR